MLTNDALDEMERHCTSSAYQFSKAEGRALVGELRAERTRTETLRAALAWRRCARTHRPQQRPRLLRVRDV